MSDHPTGPSRDSNPTLPAEVASAPPSAKIDQFVRVRKLGAGGMGEVWLAWDTRLARWVALKFLKSSDTDEAARFLREAQLAGQLTHPNIAAVYDVGEAGGQRYIAMQYVDGQTLKTAPRGDRRELVRFILDAARAVAFAHERGVIHRDLKPENMMVARSHVYVMDFGLARAAGGSSDISISGQVVGTPAYMPPEQARGERADRRSDVWSLGATLYHLLTGRAPFTGASVVETLRKVTDEDPVHPRRLDPAIDADLETVVLKCLEKEPDRRYESASALADDLDRWLRGDPVVARRAGIARRLTRWASRRKALLGVGTAGVVGMAAALLWFVPRLAERERAVALWQEVASPLADADRLARAGETGRAGAKLDEALAVCAAADFPAAKYFAARLLEAKGERAAAVEMLDRALAVDPGFGEARHLRGILGAEEYFEMMLMSRQLVMGLDWTDDEVEAKVPGLSVVRERTIADLKATGGRSAYFKEEDALYGRGMLALAQRLYPQAQRAFEDVLNRDPLYTQAAAWLSFIAFKDHALDEAERWAQKAIESHKGFAYAYVRRGQVRRARGDLAGAAEDFEKSITLRPRQGATYDFLGHTRMELGDPEGALRAFEDAVKVDANNILSLSNLATTRFRLGRNSEAASTLDAILAKHPYAVIAYLNRSSVRSSLKDLKGAEADCAAAIAVNPRTDQVWISRARVRQDARNLTGAIEDADEAVRRNSNAHSLALRAELRLAIGELKPAAVDLEAIAALAPRYPDLPYLRGYLAFKERDFEAAARHLAEAMRRHPGDWKPAGLRAVVLIELGAFTEARRIFDELTVKNPTQAIFQNRGALRIKAGDFKGALADSLRAVDMDPGDEMAWLNVGLAHLNLGSLGEARDAFQKSIDIKPAFADGLVNRGWVRFLEGDRAGARRDFDAAIEADRQCTMAWLNRGSMKADTGDIKGAIADFEEATRVDPWKPEPWENLTIAHLRLRDFERALWTADKAVAAAPKRAKAYATRAQVHHHTQEFARAVEDYTRAYEIEPDATTLANRGAAKLATGDRAGARKDLERAMETAPQGWPIRGAVQATLEGMK